MRTRETRITSYEIVADRIKELALEHLFSISGLRDPEYRKKSLDSDFDSWGFRYERSWAVGANLDMNLRIKNLSGDVVENVTFIHPERETEEHPSRTFGLVHDADGRLVRKTSHHEKARITEMEFEARITWSSTDRDLIDAQASIQLYQELVNVAATISSIIRHEFQMIGRVSPVVEKKKDECGYVYPMTCSRCEQIPES